MMNNAEVIATHRENENPDGHSIRDAKYFVIIGYISFLCFVPLLLQKNNSFAQFHGKQALMLFIIELALCIASLVPVLGKLVCTLGLVACGLASLYAIYQALTEEYWTMPFVGAMAEKINF